MTYTLTKIILHSDHYYISFKCKQWSEFESHFQSDFMNLHNSYMILEVQSKSSKSLIIYYKIYALTCKAL